MKSLLNLVKSNWRKVVSSFFILLIFTIPASKGFFAKIFNLTVEAGNKNQKDNQNNSNKDKSKTVKSASTPKSHPPASPMSNTNQSTQNQSSRHNSLGHGPAANMADKRPNLK
jgi:hypothetical protein